MTYLDYLEQKVLLERLVIGLEEPVLIKGLGELQAKIDSGNGGYNVIHGTDFHQQGNELMFTTHDSFGHEKKMQSTVIDTIEVNMGGGNIESRPVIELDIKFAGEDYKKIPFSVSDRSSNTNPILISKGFVENELEALIDVGAKNISNDGVEVIYGEGVGSVLKATGKTAWDSTKNGAEWVKNKASDNAGGLLKNGAMGMLKGAWNVGKGALKAGAGVVKAAGSAVVNAGEILQGKEGALNGVKSGLAQGVGGVVDAAKGAVGTGWNAVVGTLGLAAGGIFLLGKLVDKTKLVMAHHAAQTITQSKKLIKDDKNQIINRLNGLTFAKKLIQDQTVDKSQNCLNRWAKGNIQFTKLPVIPITSYMMEIGETKKTVAGMEQKKESLKKWLNDCKTATEAMKNGGQSVNQEQEENVFTESIILLDQDATPTPPVKPVPPTPPAQPQPAAQQPTTDAQPQPAQKKPADNKTQLTQQNQKAVQQAAKQIQEQTTFLHNLSNFSLWFIPIRNEHNERKETLNEIERKKKQIAQLEQLKKQNEAKPENDTTQSKPTELQGQSFQINEMLEAGMHAGIIQQQKQKQNQYNAKSIDEKIAIQQTELSKLLSKLENLGPDLSYSDATRAIYKENLKSDLIKAFFTSGKIDENTAAPIVQKLAQSFQSKRNPWGQGIFCLAYTNLSQNDAAHDASSVSNNRVYHFFEEPKYISFMKKQKNPTQQSEQQWISSKMEILKQKGLV